jgi:natural product biosynthesis luciferase-like monooxygenase protein/FkbM family methyltransferase
MNEVIPAGDEEGSVTSFVGSGRAGLDQEILIVDPESLRECRHGVIGEIWVSGPHVAQGYWHRPEESESTFKAYVAGTGAGPYLRTGDLGFVQAGELFVTGRLKDLIIIRGRNYFPHDIELTAESSHASLRPGGGAAFSIDVLGEEHLVVVHEVERQHDLDLTQVIGAIRQAVAEEYELQTYAIVLLKPGSLPKTSSGKIQRHACRAKFLKEEFEALATWRARTDPLATGDESSATSIQIAPDKNSIEEWLVHAVAARLRLNTFEIDHNRPIVYYGVDSLIAVDLTHAIETSFGVSLSVADLLQSPGIVDLAAEVFESLTGRAKEIQKSAPLKLQQQEAPLSYGQRALWFLHQLAPQSAAYNISAAARIRSELDVTALKKALQELAERHPALRTTFPVQEEMPVQRVNALATISFKEKEIADETALAEYLREETAAPFVLTGGPLLRVTLLRLARSEYVLVFVAHHMIVDFWSMALLINELGTCYATGNSLAAPSLDYLDYSRDQAAMLAGPEGERLWQYWQKQLSGAQTVLNIPTSRPRPKVQTYAGANKRFHLDKELTGKLKQFAQDHNSTLYTTLLAAFQVLLYRYTGQDDFVVGSPTSGRRAAAFQSVVGYFVNPVALRAQISPKMTFESLHAQVRQAVFEAMDHQDYPFGLLVERLQVERDPSRAPLFQVMFSWQQSPLTQQHGLAAFALGEGGEHVQVGGLTLEPMPLDQATAQFDLTLMMGEAGEELSGLLQYNCELFDAAAIARMAEHFRVLLDDVVSHPQKNVVDLQLLTPLDQQLLLRELNDTQTDYSEDACLHELFEAQVKRSPEQIALVFQDRQYTYSEVNRRANQLAHYLKKLGVGPEVCVGICLKRSLEKVVGLLGILKAGGAYLPLDPAYPNDRLWFMLADSQARVLLTEDGLLSGLPEQVQRVDLDSDWRQFSEESADEPASESTAENLAYVIYTSGSTGRPKGVMISHRNVVNFCTGIDKCFPPEDAGTWLAVTSISFDISVLELLWTLTRGFKVVIQAEAEITPIETISIDRKLDFSLFYFASEESGAAEERYKLLMQGAKFADEHNFTAVWTPERHFHAFGGLYSNPALTSAALATVTKRVKLRAGSVVLPLHHPIRVAEEWAFVDNISGGRIGVSFASGWHADDFVFAPENYSDRKQLMLRDLKTVCDLWRGESIAFKGGAGNDVEVKIHPRPIQPELPFWITTAGHPDTFRAAGEAGGNLLTHLLGQSVAELAEKIKIYREAWRSRNANSNRPHVTLMLHTFVGPDRAYVAEKVQKPLCRYLASSLDLARNLLRSLGHEVAAELTADDLEALLAHAFDRYYETSGLFGTPETCLQMIDRLKRAGVDEVACLIDFGVDVDSVISNLTYLDQLRARCQAEQRADEGDYSLASQLTKYGVTHMQCTPSLARLLLLDPAARTAVNTLRYLFLGGEAVLSELVDELQAITGAQVRNMYGPTETTIWSSTYIGEGGPQTMPIGKPLANQSVYVLDKQMAPVPLGVAGELYIGGTGVARGYWQQPGLTAERFVPDPWNARSGTRMYRTGDVVRYLENGNLEFLGRADEQVKLRGHRIELGEIETTLRQHPSIREAVVAIKELTPGDDCLVAYLVPHVNPETRLPNGMDIEHHGSFQTSIIYKEVFEDEVYLKHGVTLNDDDVVFDVGANIGLFTLFVNRKCPSAQIYAFEPLPPNFELLRANAARHGVDAKLFNCGLSETSALANFTFYPQAAGLSGRATDREADKESTRAIVLDWIHHTAATNELLPQSQLDELLDEYLRAETFSCPVKTLSQVIREQQIERIDLLKIDVESSELDVLSGIDDEDWPRIKQIALEVHSRSMLESISALLREHGFELVIDDSFVVTSNANGNGNDVYVAMLYAFAEPRGVDRAPSVSLEPVPPPLVISEVQEFLRRSLPTHFVPSAFVVLDALPLTPNGKIDRKALPLPSAQQAYSPANFVAPQTETEKELAAIWAEILGSDQFGIHDNFFDCGGHSLTATQLVTRIRKNFAVELSLRDFLKYPTIAGLAELIEESTLAKASDEKIFALLEMLETQSRA